MRSMHYTPPKKYGRDYYYDIIIITILRYTGIGQDVIIFLTSHDSLTVKLISVLEHWV